MVSDLMPDPFLQPRSKCRLVKFRLVVFRPFKGEVIAGKIESASEHGIKGIIQLFSNYLSRFLVQVSN